MSPHQEEVWIICLSSGLEVVHFELLFRGTLDRTVIHPREILRTIVTQKTVSFVLTHNHPSNAALPSEEDILFTAKIKKLSRLIEIPMLDHVIVTSDSFFSFRESRLFR
jgi:DNA repair protein RadC